MNKDFWERIDRLEELAGKATQGEWTRCGCEIWANETGCSHDVVGKVEKVEDAKHIAAANPAMIQEMIAELRRLEKEADWLARRLAEFCDPDHDNQCCVLCRGNCNGVDCKEWREAARKAVSEADNA